MHIGHAIKECGVVSHIPLNMKAVEVVYLCSKKGVREVWIS